MDLNRGWLDLPTGAIIGRAPNDLPGLVPRCGTRHPRRRLVARPVLSATISPFTRLTFAYLALGHLAPLVLLSDRHGFLDSLNRSFLYQLSITSYLTGRAMWLAGRPPYNWTIHNNRLTNTLI